MLSSELVSRWSQSQPLQPPTISGRPSKPSRSPTSTRGELKFGLEVETARGPFWRNDIPVAELWPEQERWLAALSRRSPAASDEVADAAHGEIMALRDALPERVLLIDLEMCDDTIFLIGAVHTHKGLPIATQLLARRESEEPAVLTALDEILAGKDALITFNGKAFDWPAVAERRSLHDL